MILIMFCKKFEFVLCYNFIKTLNKILISIDLVQLNRFTHQIIWLIAATNDILKVLFIFSPIERAKMRRSKLLTNIIWLVHPRQNTSSRHLIEWILVKAVQIHIRDQGTLSINRLLRWKHWRASVHLILHRYLLWARYWQLACIHSSS